ncbi:unnamed protein product [Dimorphilus gyrociliatus]|uniref:Short-chain specific acyl-CoA dehydrogenase, mitochondrial n=1 Tax=Dimorphilus gyrociliatus TaxID=2664684 RepID=A0A7I8VUF4_9ANNE|nr:unnamed protein product [Dimorphilus gyrociliatus]
MAALIRKCVTTKSLNRVLGVKFIRHRTFYNDALLPETHRIFKNSLRELVNEEIAPLAAKADEEGKFPMENMRKLADLGVFGLVVPEEYGGSNIGTLAYAIAMEEISRGCATTGTAVTGQTSLFIKPLLNFGTREQIEEYITHYVKGDRIGSFCLSESDNGSDAGAAKTKATLKDDHWILEGTKTFVSHGTLPGDMIVMATSDKKLKHKGISAFIVSKQHESCIIGKLEKKLGIRGNPTVQIKFEETKIPKDRILGRQGYGFKIAMTTLDGGRIGVAGLALGIAQASLDCAIKYSTERKAFGIVLSNLQAIQLKLADMQSKIEASRLLTWNAAMLFDKGENITKEAAIAKLTASETATFCSHQAIQILGGIGYLQDMPAERYYRDSRITEIYEGTSEIQRLVIAANMMSTYNV